MDCARKSFEEQTKTIMANVYYFFLNDSKGSYLWDFLRYILKNYNLGFLRQSVRTLRPIFKGIKNNFWRTITVKY